MKIFLVALCFVSGVAAAQSRSGLEFASEEIRRLQASDAENPGMLWVDQGAQRFARDCSSCHASAKGMAAKYPRVERGKVVTLAQKVRHLKPSMAYESEEMLSLTTYIAHESRGLPMTKALTKKDVARGKAEYFRRRGQMNLSCSHCHNESAGKKLGAETVSQGQPNGYPAYRLEWQTLGSIQRRLRSCLFGVHAEVPPFGSDLLNDLELYLAFRAQGLPIETPAVRR